jgi:hypothetical protein
MTKFINFGCWNKYGCNINSAFYKVSHEASKITDIDFIVVNGDNYYQDKIDSMKIVNNTDLLNGLSCLNNITDTYIYLLLGNHDLEITNGKCETLILEKAFVQGVNSQAKREKFILPSSLLICKEIEDTFLIMIDSNIYADENPSCYKEINHSNTSFELNELKLQQYQMIQDLLTKNNKKYKNIIVFAHHPLIGLKNQIVKTNKIKGGIDAYNVDLYKLFINLLRLHADNFYYMCADIHNYQEGIVTIRDYNSSMEIKQIIVGTGGTDLDDDYNEKYTSNYTGNSSLSDKILTVDIPISDGISLSYSLNKHYSDYGFIIVTIDESSNVIIEPIIVSRENTILGGKKTKKRRVFKFKKIKQKKVCKN